MSIIRSTDEWVEALHLGQADEYGYEEDYDLGYLGDGDDYE